MKVSCADAGVTTAADVLRHVLGEQEGSTFNAQAKGSRTRIRPGAKRLTIKRIF